VCNVLQGGRPADIQELKALFIADIDDAAQDIRHSNVDKFRVYWTGGRHQLGSPRDEESCRDRLIDYLRDRLSRLDIAVEPEGHMAQDKRADIVLLAGANIKLPVEIKKDTHPDLWIAPQSQLERLYTRDPHAAGHGVYLVLYFGPRGAAESLHTRAEQSSRTIPRHYTAN
jgi:hypothetical protein